MNRMTIALVTGANKGIGFEIAKQLCLELPDAQSTVILCCRNKELGEKAVEELKKLKRCNPVLQKMDVTDLKHIQAVRDFVKENYKGLDILVNNAGFGYKVDCPLPQSQQAKDTLAINYTGVVNCLQEFFPLMNPDGRVVNVASMAGGWAVEKMDTEKQKAIQNPDITLEGIEAIAQAYLEATKSNDAQKSGWPATTYGMSKALVLALGNVYSRKVKNGILINSVCPGWCRTDMAGWDKAPLSANDGAKRVLELAYLPKGSTLNGKFYSEMKEAKW